MRRIKDGTYYDSGLRTINVSNLAAPSEAGFYYTPQYAEDVALYEKYIYVADGDGGLFILKARPLTFTLGDWP